MTVTMEIGVEGVGEGEGGSGGGGSDDDDKNENITVTAANLYLVFTMCQDHCESHITWRAFTVNSVRRVLLVPLYSTEKPRHR